MARRYFSARAWYFGAQMPTAPQQNNHFYWTGNFALAWCFGTPDRRLQCQNVCLAAAWCSCLKDLLRLCSQTEPPMGNVAVSLRRCGILISDVLVFTSHPERFAQRGWFRPGCGYGKLAGQRPLAEGRGW